MVMPSNNTCWLVHYWAGKYGGLGHLLGPARVERPMPHLPYALDNGAYGAFTSGQPWNEAAFLQHVGRYAFNRLRPTWVVCPDVVADAMATLKLWHPWASRLGSDYHLKVALAVQDGMTPLIVEKLRPRPDLLFVGGTTEWKWATVSEWAKAAAIVHVGRVNTSERLELCASLGITSCDGTGWFRGKTAQILELGHFLRRQAGAPDDGDVEFMVRHSRVKGDHPELPLEVCA